MARKTAKRSTKKATKRSVKAKKVSTLSGKKLAVSKLNLLTQKIIEFRKKRYFIPVFILLIAILLLYAGRGLVFAAMVGNRPIFRYTLINQLEKRAGQDALESLITKEILNQEARKKGIAVSAEEIKAEMDRIRGIVEGQGMTLETALDAQGQTMADLEENIQLQKTVEKLMAEKIQVNDDEINEYFEKNKTIYGVGAKLEDVRESIREQLKQQKMTGEFETFLANLKSEKKIIYFLNFE